MRIGNKIKTKRKEYGMTQKALADRTGISYSFLSDIEKERSNPSFENLQRICSALNVDVSYFLGQDTSQQESNLYSDILTYINEVKFWNEDDQQELLHYLKAKSISKK